MSQGNLQGPRRGADARGRRVDVAHAVARERPAVVFAGRAWVSLAPRGRLTLLDGLKLRADDAELVAQLTAHEEEGDDGDDRDKSKDECVFGKTLTIFVVMDPSGVYKESGEHSHEVHPLSSCAVRGLLV
jgi:hypothetical protein